MESHSLTTNLFTTFEKSRMSFRFGSMRDVKTQLPRDFSIGAPRALVMLSCAVAFALAFANLLSEDFRPKRWRCFQRLDASASHPTTLHPTTLYTPYHPLHPTTLPPCHPRAATRCYVLPRAATRYHALPHATMRYHALTCTTARLYHAALWFRHLQRCTFFMTLFTRLGFETDKGVSFLMA